VNQRNVLIDGNKQVGRFGCLSLRIPILILTIL
jgi:hypothetical protein